MAHELTIRDDGSAEMAYVGETPWHGLGNKLEPGAPIEEWVVAAGMNWDIQRTPVIYGYGDKQFARFSDRHVLYRSDSKAPLSVVGSGYQIVQPKEVLEFFRDLVEIGGFQIETAGTLFGGRRFWALARMNGQEALGGVDPIEGNLLLATSADGSMKTIGKDTSVRVVCQNTMNMALGEKDRKQVAISHISTFNAEKVKETLGISRQHFEQYLRAAEHLSQFSLASAAANNFLEETLRENGMVVREDITKSRQFNRILELYNGAGMGADLKTAEGTAWGLLNAVTQFVDHEARATNMDNRLASAWFGRGDNFKTNTFQRLLALTNYEKAA